MDHFGTQRAVAKALGINVLSPAKLRDKWTQLEINRNKQQAGVTAGKPKLDLTNTDWIYGVDL
ncbi:replication protein O [Escherichia coli]|nr:replication protein O [Escherichia coli]